MTKTSDSPIRVGSTFRTSDRGFVGAERRGVPISRKIDWYSYYLLLNLGVIHNESHPIYNIRSLFYVRKKQSYCSPLGCGGF